MIEQGLVKFIQAGLGDPPIAPGGFAVMLAKDQVNATNRMAWVHRAISSEPTYVLGGQDGLTERHMAIDCHGYSMVDAMQLASAIDGVMRGAPSAVLADSDATVVQGIFRVPGFIDGFSDGNRTFVRTLEYKVIYNQT